MLIFSILILSITPVVAYAQTSADIQTSFSSSCGDGVNQPLTALYGADKGDYLVYVKLGQPQQKAKVVVQEQLLSGTNCQKIGSIEATGDKWQQVGVWKSLGKDQPTSFSLSSPIVNGLPDANRPSIMLISKTKPACVPAVDCEVTVNGRQGVVNPVGTLLNEDTLHVLQPVDPSSGSIRSVDYYIDSKPAYSTKQLEDFNLRYVGPGKHKLSTVVNYSSKQQVIIEGSVDRSLGDGVNYIFYSTLYNNRTLVTMAASLALFALVWMVLLSIVRKLYLRHLWKVTHIIDTHTDPIAPSQDTGQAPVAQVIQPAQAKVTHSSSWVHTVFQYSLFLAVSCVAAIILIFVINGFVLQIYHVDGPSMNTTLHTGQRLIVNKLGKTWSRISRQPYTPKRGDIVVCLKAQSFYDSGEQNYIVKRVIGLPGERVVVNDGVITVYNDQHPEGFNPDQNVAWSKNIQKSSGERIDLTVGQGEIFVVGDNRPESIDSRSYGPINTNNVIGTANRSAR